MAAVDGGDNDKTRRLFGSLRENEDGVSFERLAQCLYFLQRESFMLLDVLGAFRSSTSASDQFLSYRDFQLAFVKIARARNEASPSDNVATGSASKRMESALIAALVDEIVAVQTLTTNRMDTIRRQISTPTMVETLHRHSPKLMQSFRIYGPMSRVTRSKTEPDNDARNANPHGTITFEGFLDFLNAYFEYEDYCSYQELSQMMAALEEAINDGWQSSQETRSRTGLDAELSYPQFVELFCRVASAFHRRTLTREGTDLRRAAETCRLEFSIELLLQHMDISIIREFSMPSSVTASAHDTPENENPVDNDPAKVAIQAGGETDNSTETGAIEEIAELLAAWKPAKKTHHSKLQNGVKRSVLFSRLPPRRSRPVSAPSTPTNLASSASVGLNRDDGSAKPLPPQVVMIREIVAPPPMPANILDLVEQALKYQNIGQYHMALSALDECGARYNELTDELSSENDGEVLVYIDLLVASVFDSARKDSQAVNKYCAAFKAASVLAPGHPARALVRSCMACTLFYLGELSLAKRATYQVLEERKVTVAIATKACRGDAIPVALEVDMATAMNNYACCLSQDHEDAQIAGLSKLEEAFLLFKEAARIYTATFGATHPRVEIVRRNLASIRGCRTTLVCDPHGAVERGEYTHVIPGSVFQIKALEPVASLPTGKKGKKGKKGKGGKKKTK